MKTITISLNDDNTINVIPEVLEVDTDSKVCWEGDSEAAIRFVGDTPFSWNMGWVNIFPGMEDCVTVLSAEELELDHNETREYKYSVRIGDKELDPIIKVRGRWPHG